MSIESGTGFFSKTKLRLPESYSSLSSYTFILLFAFLANLPSLKCFFFADDFLCLDYLYRIFHGEPQLFLERLVSPWQHPSVSLLYRPVCDLALSSIYCLFGANEIYYHLFNLLVHCFNSVLVYVLTQRLSKSFSTQSSKTMAFLAALIFACYPLHVEPIVWIVGNSDLLCTCFFLSSLVLTLAAFEQDKKFSIPASLSFLLALLSKEAAATLPFIVLSYLLLSEPTKAGRRQFLLAVFKGSLPFFLLLCFYFLLRFLVLGSLLGGYAGSLGENFSAGVLDRLLSPSTYLLLGMGTHLGFFEADSILVTILHLAYLSLALILILRAALAPWSKETSLLLGFFLVSTCLTLAPTFKVFGLTGTLSNARIFYLPSCFYIPFMVCACLSGLSGSALGNKLASKTEKLHSILFLPSCLSLCLIALVFLFISNGNYRPWLEGSRIIKTLQCQLYEKLKSSSGRKQCFLLNLYPNWKGAHLLYEFKEIKSLLGPNFYGKDVSGGLIAMGDFHGFYMASSERIERLCRQSRRRCNLLFFDCLDKKLLDLSLEQNMVSSPASPLIDSCAISQAPALEPGQKAYFLKLSRPSVLCDNGILELETKWRQPAGSRMVLTGFVKEGQSLKAADVSAGSLGPAKAGLCKLHFSLMDLRRSFGTGPAQFIYLRLPPEAVLLSASILGGNNIASICPDLSELEELGNGNYKPRRTESASTCHILLDVTKVPGAEGILLERAQAPFSFDPGLVCGKDPREYGHLAETVLLKSKQANYCIDASKLSKNRHAFRAFAVDKSGKRIGFASDIVCIDRREP